MRIDAALTDEPEPGQPVQQVGLDFRALADKHEAFGILQTAGEHAGILRVIVPDFDVVTFQLVEASKRTHRVKIIVENGNLHQWPSSDIAKLAYAGDIARYTAQAKWCSLTAAKPC